VTVTIAARFNGPPGSGNGGYCAGVFAFGAAGAADPIEVTLRKPPPLDRPLSVVDGDVREPDGTLIATVAPGAPVTGTVPPVPRDVALDAARSYDGFAGHPFGSCYVCGPDRADGLRIFPGRLADGTTAAPWTVPGDVGPETVWAALDCPGGWTVLGPGRACVLGRIAVHTAELPKPGSECVVRGALVATSGRKSLVHTTLYGPDGAELARARATWIEITL
jgi:hypothetical protein